MKNNLAKLIEKRDKLNLLINEQKKRDEKRELILVGSALLRAIKEGKVKSDFKNQLLDLYINNRHDREFLGLEPLEHHVNVDAKPQEANNNNGNNYQPEYQHHHN